MSLSSANASISLNPGEQDPVVLIGHAHQGKKIIPNIVVCSWSFSKAENRWRLISVNVHGYVVNVKGLATKIGVERQALTGYTPEPKWADDAPDWLKTLVLCNPPQSLGR